MAIYQTFGNSNPFDFEKCTFTGKQRLLNVYTLFQIFHRLWMEESLSIGVHDHRGLKIRKGSNRQFFAVNFNCFGRLFSPFCVISPQSLHLSKQKRNEILLKIHIWPGRSQEAWTATQTKKREKTLSRQIFTLSRNNKLKVWNYTVFFMKGII